MSGLGTNPETGFPYELPGAMCPKPGSDFGPQVPEGARGPSKFPSGHQSPPASQQVTVIAGSAMQIITGE